MTFLGLYFQSRLESLVGVGALGALDTLAVENCKHIGAIDDVATLTGLTTLKLANCGDIASLRPMMSLQAWEELFAREHTRITDLDLSVLLQLPRLRK